MKYEEIRHLSEEQFRRLTGVKRLTFNRMIDILQKEFVIKKARGGSPNKVSIPDMLLMTLEYRTYFHIASSYVVTKAQRTKRLNWYKMF
jgi:hypothetical protein